jgi:hypothetical protein
VVPCVGVKDKADYSAVQVIIYDKDTEALQEFLGAGKGIFLDEGTEVTLVKSADLFTMWQVRVKGSSKLWWVRTDMMNKPTAQE